MRAPLHIAVVCSTFPKLSETFVLDHVTSLLDRGHRVTIVAATPLESELIHPTVTQYGLAERMVLRGRVPRGRVARHAALLARGLTTRPGRWPAFAAAARWGFLPGGPHNVVEYLTALERLDDVDIVHCHFGTVGAPVAEAMQAGRMRFPLVTTFHGVDVGRFMDSGRHRRYVNLFAHADALLTVSDYQRRQLLKFGAPPGKVRVVRQGVDVGALSFRPRAEHVDRRSDTAGPLDQAAPAAGQPWQLLSIGRLVEKKGFATGLRAVAELARRGVDVHYRIIGGGPQQQRLAGMVSEHGLAGRVELCQPSSRAEVQQALYESDAMLVPSQTAADGDREGIPVVLMEAMACGLPVVATRHSGIPELVEDGVTGLLADEEDPTRLADALQQLHDDPALAQRLATGGRARIEHQHAARQQVDQLEQLYFSLLAARSPARP